MTACGTHVLYTPSACKSEEEAFQCAMVESNEATRECNANVDAYQRRQREEEEHQRAEKQHQQQEASRHEQSDRERRQQQDRDEAWRKEERREENKRFWDKQEARYREERNEVIGRNIERQSRANDLISLARDLMHERGDGSHTVGDSARSSVADSLGGVELALAGSGAKRDATNVGDDLLDGLGNIATIGAPLATIPINLTVNTFKANLHALDEAFTAFDAGNAFDAHRVSDRYVQSAFGLSSVMTVVLSPPVDALSGTGDKFESLQRDLLMRGGASEDSADRWMQIGSMAAATGQTAWTIYAPAFHTNDVWHSWIGAR